MTFNGSQVPPKNSEFLNTSAFSPESVPILKKNVFLFLVTVSLDFLTCALGRVQNLFLVSK